ncbi:MAG: threonylcarbamoyl-AMP synthase [Cytophagales bacterium]|nr:threonylcarbamoyl-AMP synthase [Cytophagales bacterium]MCA6378684.1 threonylcarbamoyl-AMP synthase [Cytophagales bacterium]MCA6387727.1 threonylcarbamoyl-AMP synthase [Cytophagales bacterium]MCA6393030.1 threonylcarbamoyl-AMP synthase [Cytophagales bacterium]MCA6400264.1 threonylcarbamoyl-AMP synthase [Cytophagales bacterium]
MAEIGTNIRKAKALLENGELVGIPTETVYGLAGNALSVSSVAKIFQVKDRPFFDPLIIHVADIGAIGAYVEKIPPLAAKLAHAFWPGPLTLVLPKKQNIPDLVTSGIDTVGIRCPAHSLTQQLLKELSFPLAAPSANPFGYISPTKASHVNDQLGEKIQYILDGGECKVGIESTIVGFENNQPKIYRMGGLSLEEIESVVGKTDVHLHSSSNPKAPGQLQSHYSPKKKLVLGDLKKLVKIYGSNHVGVLAFNELQNGLKPNHQRVLSPTGDLIVAAQNLFSYLRELDQLNVEIILAEEVPVVGLGRAINDRLRRASAEIGR